MKCSLFLSKLRKRMIILTMLGAFLLEWSFPIMTAGKIIFVPLSVLVFCLWIWHMEFEARLWFALITGFIMDTIYLVPFGASLLTCVALALASEACRTFFSNTESRIVQNISVLSLIFLFFGMVPGFGFVLGKFV